MQTLQQWAFASKQSLISLILLALLLSATIVFQGYSIVQIVNLVFIKNAHFNQILPFIYIITAAIFMRLFSTFLIMKIGANLAERVKNNIRAQLLQRWTASPVESQLEKQTGSKVKLLIDTVDELESYYKDYMPQLIKTLIVPVVVLIAVFFAHPTSALIMLITAPFIPITYVIIGMQTQRKTEQQLEAMNRFSGKFLDLLQGLQTLRLFGQSNRQQQALATSNRGFMQTTLDVLKIAFASTLFIELITTLGVGLVALEIGFQMIVFQSLAFAPAFFVLTLAPEYYNSLKELGAAFHTGRGSLGAAKLIEDELKKPFTPVHWGQQRTEQLPPSIEVRQATYTYPNGPTIGPLSIYIPANKTIAIIGPTGHGKTTALNMLSSMVELASGDIFINGQNRQHIKEVEWTRAMAYISQQPYLFAGTLRDNISMGQMVKEEQIIIAIQKAQLDDWFLSLEHGLDTKIGEGGRGLSGGEQQRVALARAFLKNPRIVFFDEPTAGLDVQTEKLISAAMTKLSESATCIIVAHRFESIKQADYLYMIENGQIIAQGTHAELTGIPYYETMRRGGTRDE